jgi:hypothetical protein
MLGFKDCWWRRRRPSPGIDVAGGRGRWVGPDGAELLGERRRSPVVKSRGGAASSARKKAEHEVMQSPYRVTCHVIGIRSGEGGSFFLI